MLFHFHLLGLETSEELNDLFIKITTYVWIDVMDGSNVSKCTVKPL